MVPVSAGPVAAWANNGAFLSLSERNSLKFGPGRAGGVAPDGTIAVMRPRLARTSLFAAAWLLVLTPSALAQEDDVTDNGEGFLGEVDDKIVTFFSLGVVVFFTIVVILATLVQQRLERRKDEKKASRVRQRIGW